MAKGDPTETPEADRIAGVRLPREAERLFGHGEAEAEFLDAFRAGRLHHAWLVTGPKGIGKATFAFRAARFLLANGDPRLPAVDRATDLTVGADHPVFRRVAGGSHGNLLHLRRPVNERTGRFMTELTVDEVRRTVAFFGSTAAEGGWRIGIVDAADDMNRASSNALLKVLEEPPARALFFVLAHRPGALLPTIRSRCRLLPLAALDDAAIGAALDDTGVATRHSAATRTAAIGLADGSARRAILLMETGGVDLALAVRGLADALPAVDVAAVHALADKVAGRDADDAFDVFEETVADLLVERAKAAGSLARAEVWARAHRAVGDTFRRADALNLDRKATVLAVFRSLAEAARTA